jgi:parallel beta-helix repeat protein
MKAGPKRRVAVSGRASLLLIGLIVSTSFVSIGSPVAHASATIYVAPWGNDSGAGTLRSPVKTVRHAVWRANSGDAIVLRGGTYRESVQIHGKAVAISSAPGERAVFDGTQQLSGWRRSGADWYVDGWTHQFPRAVGGPVAASRSAAGFPELVFRNGKPLDQVLRRIDVVPGTFFHDNSRDRIYVADDPVGARVEASSIEWALYFRDADGSSVRNVTVRRFATPASDVAAIRAHSNNMVISGVTSELNAAAGISAIGNNIVIRKSQFSDNGYLGIHAHNSNTLVIEDSTIVGNNKAGFDARHSAGGIKVTTSTGITIRNNEVSRNGGPGIWTDLSARWVTISYNRVEQNGRSGIEVELSSDVNVASNVTIENGEAGIWILESQNVQVFNNATYRNVREIYVLEGLRRHVSNVAIKNNIIGDGRGGSALVVVEDWTRQRSAAQMGVRVDFNAYWQPRTSPVTSMSRWGEWPTNVSINTTLADHQSSTGQDKNSLASTSWFNPYRRGPSLADYRAPTSVQLGTAVSGALASELGVPAGSRPRIGPMTQSKGAVTRDSGFVARLWCCTA